MSNESNNLSGIPLLLKDESIEASHVVEREPHPLPVFDTQSDTTFDDLIALGSILTDTPLGAISIVDKEREWIRSTHGFDPKQFKLSPALAAETIREQEPCFVIPDATQDERFAKNPLVIGDPHIRFYAGVPMLNAQGVPLGIFSVMDRKPRQLTPRQMELLQHIARITMDLAERERHRLILQKHVLFGGQVGLSLPDIISRIASPTGEIQTLVSNLIAEYTPILGRVAARIQRFHKGAAAELFHTPDEPPTGLQQIEWVKLDQSALLATDVIRQGVIHAGEPEETAFFYAIVPLKFTTHVVARVDFICTVPQDNRFDNLFNLMITSFSYLAEKVIHLEELKFYVDHDSLTDLGSRSLLISELEKVIQLTRAEQPIAVLFHIRLESLAEINDNYGYTAGDDALVEAARRLRSLQGGKAFVARVGGDNFMVLMRDENLEKNFPALLSEVEV